MRGEGFSESADSGLETRYDPEVEELLELLGIYQKIQEILAWLIEAGPGFDPVIVAIKRASLHGLMQQLGLEPEDPQALVKLEEIKNGLLDRMDHPQPRVDVPGVSFFASRIKEIVAEGRLQYTEYIRGDEVNLAQLAEHGHTDWHEITSRTGRASLAAYTHGLARIMADPIAYQAEFGGLGIDPSLQTADHLEVNREWSIQNGRHRSLATRSLGPEYVAEAGMAQWIPVVIEEV